MCPRCYSINFKDRPVPWILRDRDHPEAGWIFNHFRFCLSCGSFQILGLIDGPGDQSAVAMTGRAADGQAAGRAGVGYLSSRLPVLVCCF